MYIYISFFSLLTVGSIIDFSNFSRNIKNLFFGINILLFFIIVSTRTGIGTDYYQYQELFSYAKPLYEINTDYFLSNPHSIEYGYLLFESLIKTFTNNFHVFIFIYNIIFFSFLYAAVRRYPFKNLQLLLFFSLFHVYYISGHRQAIAMVILFYNLRYLLDRNFIKFSFFIILAYIFHRSSLIYIIAYFILSFNVKKKVLVGLISLVSFVMYYDLFGVLIEYCYTNYKDVNYMFSRIYQYYFIQYSLEPVNIFNYLKVILIGFLAMIFYKSENKKINKLGIILFLYALLFFSLSRAGGIAFRISDMFLIAIIPYLSLLLENLKYRNFLLLLSIIYSAIVFFRILYVHVVFNINTFLPYETIFKYYM